MDNESIGWLFFMCPFAILMKQNICNLLGNLLLDFKGNLRSDTKEIGFFEFACTMFFNICEFQVLSWKHHMWMRHTVYIYCYCYVLS